MVAIPIVIVGATMLAWTWLGWPDPVVDFGRELYVPWQLSQGKVLYRDIAHFNGPLSQYFNALLFKMLGVSLRTLILANIAIAGTTVVMIYKLFRAAGDRVSALAASLCFVSLFMCLQLVGIGNYNWITPYSHEITHGTSLSLASMLALISFISDPRPRWAAVCGALLGLVFLTKPEVFAAAAPAVGLGFAMALRLRASPRAILAFAFAFVAPAVASVLLLSIAMPIHDALRGTLGGWWYVWNGKLGELAFYQHTSGADHPLANLARAAIQAVTYLALFAPAYVIDRSLSTTTATRWLVACIYATVLAVTLMLLRPWLLWEEAFRGLVVVIAAAAGVMLSRAARERPVSPRTIVRTILVVFAALLLAKIALAVSVYHYGFALAMPAFLVSLAIGTSWLGGRTLCLATLAAAAVTVSVHLNVYARLYHEKSVQIAAGTSDSFRGNAFGRLVNDAAAMASSIPAGSAVAVVPQGVMINYLAQRPNPTPYVTLMPPEVLMFGDGKIRDAYAKSPPDLIVLVDTDFREYGFTSFEDYAPQTSRWLKQNYVQVAAPLPDQARAFVRRR